MLLTILKRRRKRAFAIFSALSVYFSGTRAINNGHELEKIDLKYAKILEIPKSYPLVNTPSAQVLAAKHIIDILLIAGQEQADPLPHIKERLSALTPEEQRKWVTYIESGNRDYVLDAIVRAGAYKVFEYLLSTGVLNPNKIHKKVLYPCVYDNGGLTHLTPLQVMVHMRSSRGFELLLEHGADPRKIDQIGRDALHHILQYEEHVKFALESARSNLSAFNQWDKDPSINTAKSREQINRGLTFYRKQVASGFYILSELHVMKSALYRMAGVPYKQSPVRALPWRGKPKVKSIVAAHGMSKKVVLTPEYITKKRDLKLLSERKVYTSLAALAEDYARKESTTRDADLAKIVMEEVKESKENHPGFNVMEYIYEKSKETGKSLYTVLIENGLLETLRVICGFEEVRLNVKLVDFPAELHPDEGRHINLTPLHIAALYGSPNAFQIFEESGADISRANDSQDRNVLEYVAVLLDYYQQAYDASIKSLAEGNLSNDARQKVQKQKITSLQRRRGVAEIAAMLEKKGYRIPKSSNSHNDQSDRDTGNYSSYLLNTFSYLALLIMAVVALFPRREQGLTKEDLATLLEEDGSKRSKKQTKGKNKGKVNNNEAAQQAAHLERQRKKLQEEREKKEREAAESRARDAKIREEKERQKREQLAAQQNKAKAGEEKGGQANSEENWCGITLTKAELEAQREALESFEKSKRREKTGGTKGTIVQRMAVTAEREALERVKAVLEQQRHHLEEQRKLLEKQSEQGSGSNDQRNQSHYDRASANKSYHANRNGYNSQSHNRQKQRGGNAWRGKGRGNTNRREYTAANPPVILQRPNNQQSRYQEQQRLASFYQQQQEQQRLTDLEQKQQEQLQLLQFMMSQQQQQQSVVPPSAIDECIFYEHRCMEAARIKGCMLVSPKTINMTYGHDDYGRPCYVSTDSTKFYVYYDGNMNQLLTHVASYINDRDASATLPEELESLKPEIDELKRVAHSANLEAEFLRVVYIETVLRRGSRPGI